MGNDPALITKDTIRSLLAAADRPLTRRQLSDALELDHAQSDERLRPVLQHMVRSGEVVRNRRAAYGLARDMDLIAGRVSAHADGFGFMVPDEGGDDLYLSPRQMRQVMHGDRVLAAVTGIDRRGRKEGGIVEVVERAHQQIVGRFMLESGIALVVPDDPRLTQDVLVPLDKVAEAQPGQIVVVHIDHPPTMERGPVGHIHRVLGRADEPGIATDMAIFAHQLTDEFPEAVLAEAEGFGETVGTDWQDSHRDLREMPLVTIDGADARDFDDAVYGESLADGGFRLVVAIADVAEYVRVGQPLDQEARQRGTSVYFPDRVLPMLPETLSNGLCSLRPKEDRLAVVCDMRLDARGKVVKCDFYEAVIHSQARLTYDQVERLLVHEDAELRQRYQAVMISLEALFAIYQSLTKRRARRGALDFDSDQVQFEFDAEGRVAGIRKQQRLHAHRLIEECMIAANVEAARWVSQAKLPMLFRVHEPPQTHKLEALEAFLGSQGLKKAWQETPEPAQFAALQRQMAGQAGEPLLNAVLLRSLSLAVYQPENKGHFGLALGHYAHFTSPIRRYPDLLLHRAIKHLCRRRSKQQFAFTPADMVQFGRHCSFAERRAEEASRDVDERLKVQFMQRHVGERFGGVISGVTSFGAFVDLTEFGISGLVHVTAMPDDYYQFDPERHRLVGKRRGLAVQLADVVEIEVINVNLSERKIDLALVSKQDAKQAKKKRGQARP